MAFTLALTLLLLGVVLWNGLGVFWPASVHLVTLGSGERLLGEIVEVEAQPAKGIDRLKIKVGNRENGAAFRWVDRADIRETTEPADAYKLDRMTNLNYYGFLKDVQTPELPALSAGTPREQLAKAMASARAVKKAEIDPIQAEESVLENQLASVIEPKSIALKYEKKQLERRRAAAKGQIVPEVDERIATLDRELESLKEREAGLKAESHTLAGRRNKAEVALRSNVAVFVDSHGHEQSLPLIDIVRFTRPNEMGVGAKLAHYGAKIWEMLWDDPREANQDGGLFPAIFGTVLLVFLMAITCFPLGVLAGIYLGEYAKQGPLVRLVRVAVNNLAGIPSIVYGIFGLGFFIYLCGGGLDNWLFPEWVDAGKPVFGQGCIFWASLTLAC